MRQVRGHTPAGVRRELTRPHAVPLEIACWSTHNGMALQERDGKQSLAEGWGGESSYRGAEHDARERSGLVGTAFAWGRVSFAPVGRAPAPEVWVRSNS